MVRAYPDTIALIPDGNRRWARTHRLSILQGYSLGVKKFIDFSEWCMDYGINSITVWALSSENVKRNSNELRALFNVYKRVANDDEILERLQKNQTRVRIISNPALIPRALSDSLHRIEVETMRYSGRIINMLLGYGGRDDILHAATQYAINNRGSDANPEQFKQYLMSKTVPDIDLVIRTSGEQRLSGFMPWQASYAELYFSKKLWPDFARKDLEIALEDYSTRQRRFGR